MSKYAAWVVVLELREVAVTLGARLAGFEQQGPIVIEQIVGAEQHVGGLGIVLLPFAGQIAARIRHAGQGDLAIDGRRRDDRRLLRDVFAVVFQIELERK